MTRSLSWALLILAGAQFLAVALPPGNADLISIQSLALDFSRGDAGLIYPGRDFDRNDEWIAHHAKNLLALGDKGEPNWCFYPPLIPFLLSPLAKSGAETWRIVWGIMQLGLAALYALLIRRLVMRVCPCRASDTALIFALVLGSYPVARAIQLGQTSLLIAVILWAGILAAERRRSWWRPIAVAAASFVKPFLPLVEIPELFRRRFARVAATAGLWGALGLVSWILLGASVHRDYVEFLKTLGSTQTAYYGNQSLLAGFLRLLTDWPVMDYGFASDPGWFAAGRLLALIVLAAALCTELHRRADGIAAAGLWLSVALLALPISWEHHLLLLLPVIAWRWVTAPAPRIGSRALLAAAAILMGVCWLPWYGAHGSGRLIACFPLAGNLLLFGRLIGDRFRPAADATRSASV
ncbi:MAG: glycosyltransferase family 87 protein [bacterium]|nr:glycosyltransferase family 87 protein [bacterium]